MCRYLLCVLFCLLFIACDRRPSDVMDKQQMADVLTDVHITESAVELSQKKISKMPKHLYSNSVFEKHGITKEDFDRSVEWYALHPEKYIEVYDIVENRLDSLAKDIENYVYHPDEKPTFLDSIDSLNIWDKRPCLTYSAVRRSAFDSNDLEFYCSNVNLECGDHYRLTLRMRAYDPDTVRRLLYLVVKKEEDKCDTLSCGIRTDSVLRRYSLTIRLSDTVCPQSLTAVLIDSLEKVSSLEVDSVHLYRVYNFYEHALSSSYKRKLKARQDSAAQFSVKTEEKLKYYGKKSGRK